MVRLIKAQVLKYKSIEDSTAVPISENVTVLVGKNESGKTAFLEALNKAIPLSGPRFSIVSDYPRKDLISYRSRHTSGTHDVVVQLTFAIESSLADLINSEVFHGEVIIPPGMHFTRNTDYGNTDTVGMKIDQTAALKALQKPLLSLEFCDEVFAGSSALATVLTKIEAKNLSPETKLGSFAILWRTRAGTAANWDIVNFHIWHSYLSPNMPKFLYFDDYKILEGKINLPSLKQRQETKQLTSADETAQGLLQLAGTSLDELMSDEGYETAKAKLEAIGLDITKKIFKFWQQNKDLEVEFDVKTDSKDTPPFNSGPNLYIRIKNRRHGNTLPFDQRSKGFIWFFSFLVWFDSVQARASTKDALILLLDEPGLNLHALAQADFLTYIRELSEQHQIIYSTHSPFMVESDRLKDVRVVEDRISEGTKVSAELAGSSDESIFPLQAALGYSIAQNLFIAKKNILVEGPADLILLQHLASILEAEGKMGLGDAILVPVGGLDKLATFVALLGSNKLKIVVLHDRASKPHQKLEDLVKQKLIERKRVLDYSMFLEDSSTEADVEDMLPLDVYIAAFNATYSKQLLKNKLTSDDLGAQPRIVERINHWLKTRNLELKSDGGFNHYRVAQTVLPMLTAQTLKPEGITRFERLFDRISKVF